MDISNRHQTFCRAMVNSNIGESKMNNHTTLLHQWEISPFCGKVRRILDAKEIPYRTKNYNGALVPLAAKLTGVGKLPVLDINGDRIADSRNIAHYLEKNFPDSTRLMPRSVKQCAEVALYEDWADASLYWYNFYFRLKYDDAWSKTADYFSQGRPVYEKLIVNLVGRKQFMKQLDSQGLGRYPKQTVEERFRALIKQLNVTLSDKEWLVGNTKTLADISVSSQLHEIKRTSHLATELTDLSSLNNWLKRT